MSEKRIRVIRFCPTICDGDMIIEFTEKSWNSLWQFIQEGTPHDNYSVTIDDMNEDEFKNLPDHVGW